MTTARTLARRLRGTPLYPLIEAVRDQVPGRRQDRDRRADFYSQFVAPGSLVFDIGANVGNRVQVFLAIGARVVAVEPQQFCVETLSPRWGRNSRLTILPMGISDEP